MNIDDPSFVNPPLGETASYNGFGWYLYTAPSSPCMQHEYPIPTSITEQLAHPVTILPYPDSEPTVYPCFHVTGPTPHSLCKPLAPRSPAADLSSSVPSTYDAGPAPVQERQTAYGVQQTDAATHHSTSIITTHPLRLTDIYRKKPRPPAAYSSDIPATTERCRADGGEENAIALLPVIFSRGISEKALIRKMTREEAREQYGGGSAQVYRMLLRNDDVGRFHCRLCPTGANEGGWKRARDVLRHLKRDHLGLGDACISCGWLAYTKGEMNRHRCKV